MRILYLLPALSILSACYDPADNCLNETDAKISAYVAAQQVVESKLRSPSTAEFPNYSDRSVVVIFVRECHFKVSGHVDSQNGFGTIVRSTFFLDIEADPTGGHYASDILVY